MGALSVTANAHYREPFEPLIPGVTFVVARRHQRTRSGGHRSDRGDHRRTDPGRRRRASAVAGVCGGDRARHQGDRHAADRRRNPVRPRAHRAAVPLPVVRMDAGSGHGRQGDRIGHPDRRGARRRARRRRKSSPAITARPTAATCCRRARRCTCSSSYDELAPHISPPA